MEIDPGTAYRVISTRDARFDGRLFVGVTSTGVYCRPICRVRMPKRENCRFFATPAQAEAASFRPCLKCRPEIAPGPGLAWSVMDASRTLAHQVAQALDAQAADGDDGSSLAALAARIGVSDRHLRRIFLAEHGVTPVQYLRTRRLLLAKQLLTDTRLPVAQIALQCGFRSLRRFNAAFAESYRMSPSRLRGGSREAAEAAPTDDAAVCLVLGFREPYDRAALLRFVAQRAIPGVEVAGDGSIRRTVRAGVVGTAPGWLETRFVDGGPRVQLRFPIEWAGATARVVGTVRRWLDLDAAPEQIALALADLPEAVGLRLPGSVDPFELAVRAVLGQQVTVAAARTLARRFVERFGTPIATPWPDLAQAFPAPETIARIPPARIGELGIIGARAEAIVALGRHWPAISPLLALRAAPEPLIDALAALPGIGPWTAHYIAMRALGWPDAFPPGDVAALKAMRERFGIDTPRAALAHAETWRPWRAYALLRLWKSLEG